MTATRVGDLNADGDADVAGNASVGGDVDVAGAVSADSGSFAGDVAASAFAGTFPRLASAAQGNGTFSSTTPQNLFTLNDGDAVLLLITARSGSDAIWAGVAVRNVNLYTNAWLNQGVSGMTLSMSGNTLRVAPGAASSLAFKYSYVRLPAF